MFRLMFNPRSVRSALKCFVPKTKWTYSRSLAKLSFGVVYAESLDINNHDKIEHELDLKRATKEGEKYLSELICMLRTLILETSIEYQECLIQQIELIKQNTQVGPVGQHWDQLTHVRIKGNELKDELHKYEALAKNIGDIADNQSSPLLTGNEVVLDTLNAELLKLRKLCDMQLKEISRYEKELLEANRDSILNDKS